jgi:hypothetical protein
MSIVEVQHPVADPVAEKPEGDLRLAGATAIIAAVVCVASVVMLLTGLGV